RGGGTGARAGAVITAGDGSAPGRAAIHEGAGLEAAGATALVGHHADGGAADRAQVDAVGLRVGDIGAGVGAGVGGGVGARIEGGLDDESTAGAAGSADAGAATGPTGATRASDAAGAARATAR